jgi:hypothetical protein
MKSFLTFLFFCLFLTSKGQEKLLDILPSKEGVVTYSEVVQVDSISKAILYNRAKKWFVASYKSAKEVIQLDDSENGEITGKGNFKVSYYTREPFISHTISIFVKDGRYKYLITDMSYSDNQNEKFSIESFPKSWVGKKKLYLKIDEEIIAMILSLKKYMTSKENNEW